jgi:ABC-type sulfate/molybdate transport systems ATPase subunit
MDGEHEVHGSTAYVPQDAWIINATVRDNILFGKPFDEQLYRRVLSASALETDLKIMPAGDQTEIGDRGINLSGGQRQRVSIARSLYADRDLIVLDDPLSAVDSHVAAHLVEHMLKGYIKNQGKTAVMVTNQLQFLPAADQVVLLMDGRIAEIGTFQQLMANGKEFTQLINDFGGMGGEEKKHELSEDDPQLLSPPMERLARNGSKEEEKSTLNYDAPVESTEERESGAVSFGVFWYYIRAGGVSLYFFAAFLMVVIAALRVFYSIWLSWWASPDPAVSGQFSKETCTLH